MKPYIVRHGEVILKEVAFIPKEAKLQKETSKFIVAHSETGHHHTLVSNLKDFKVFTLKGDTYLEVPEMSELLHEKTGNDVHTSHKIVPNKYKVIIKKHFDYFAKKMSQVRD